MAMFRGSLSLVVRQQVDDTAVLICQQAGGVWTMSKNSGLVLLKNRCSSSACVRQIPLDKVCGIASPMLMINTGPLSWRARAHSRMWYSAVRCASGMDRRHRTGANHARVSTQPAFERRSQSRWLYHGDRGTQVVVIVDCETHGCALRQ